MIKYIELYRDYMLVTKGCSKNTIESYLRDIKQYFAIIDKYGEGEYLHYLVKNNYSVNSQNRKISALNSYYKFLNKFNYASTNPFYNIEFAKKERRIPDCLTYEEVVRLIKASQDDLLDNALIEVLYGCGLRVSELISLKISDIHYSEALIECHGKGNKQRYVPINKKALYAINNYKINLRDKLDYKESEDILFLSKKGKILKRESVNKMLNEMAKKAHINKRVYPHLLRHSFSTHLLENGANLRSIQVMLGHENLSTTEIYTHVNKKKLQQDYNKFFKE